MADFIWKFSRLCKNIVPNVEQVELEEFLLDALSENMSNILRMFKLSTMRDIIERIITMDCPSMSDIRLSSTAMIVQLIQTT